MSKRSIIGRGIFYTRDSGGKHETTPGEYVRWCQNKASKLGVNFRGTPAQIDKMIRTGLAVDDDIFLDYGVKGNQLQRPGLDALFRIALTDKTVSHVFIPRRDRLARPDEPIDAVQMEKKLRAAGLTLVFMDITLGPVARGQRDLSEEIVALIDYDRAGRDRRDLAQKIIYAQITLARAGFSTGGRPPFGFRRWLVMADGTPVRELEAGERVRKAGHHVIWLPGPENEIALVRRIMEMLKTTPACRVAAILTQEKIPSPDSGRHRTDHGIKHATSGVWHQTTIVNIARHPLLGAITSYGRRSMGDRLRFSPNGPRELADVEILTDKKVKVVVNAESDRIEAPARFGGIVDPDCQKQVLSALDRRAGTQRGKPRSRDASRNPLGARIFDMSCGWPMYRQPYNKSFRYACGLYQQSHGAECKHNHVDGLVATRFLLGCIQQRLVDPVIREKVAKKLRGIAERERRLTSPNGNLANVQTKLADVRAKCRQVGENMALAQSQDQFKAIAATFERLKSEERALEQETHRLGRTTKVHDLDAEVAAALSGLDRLADLVTTMRDLTAVGKLFEQMNARIFLRFAEARWKNRKVNKVASGAVTFGASPPPIELYEGLTGRKYLKATPPDKKVVGERHDQNSPDNLGNVSDREGKSLGNVNRGDWI